MDGYSSVGYSFDLILMVMDVEVLGVMVMIQNGYYYSMVLVWI